MIETHNDCGSTARSQRAGEALYRSASLISISRLKHFRHKLAEVNAALFGLAREILPHVRVDRHGHQNFGTGLDLGEPRTALLKSISAGMSLLSMGALPARPTSRFGSKKTVEANSNVMRYRL